MEPWELDAAIATAHKRTHDAEERLHRVKRQRPTGPYADEDLTSYLGRVIRWQCEHSDALLRVSEEIRSAMVLVMLVRHQDRNPPH